MKYIPDILLRAAQGYFDILSNSNAMSPVCENCSGPMVLQYCHRVTNSTLPIAVRTLFHRDSGNNVGPLH